VPDRLAQAARPMVHAPMGRFASADEIATVELLVASDRSSYVNAPAPIADGGITRRTRPVN
jgi:hypothetical protein